MWAVGRRDGEPWSCRRDLDTTEELGGEVGGDRKRGRNMAWRLSAPPWGGGSTRALASMSPDRYGEEEEEETDRLSTLRNRIRTTVRSDGGVAIWESGVERERETLEI